MALRRTTIYWRPLPTVSEHHTPGAFLDFCKALQELVVREQFSYTAEGKLSEAKVREHMVDALARALTRRADTLPSIGHEVVVNGEPWHLILNVTAMPHFRVAVVERESMPALKTEYRSHLVRTLIDQDERSYGLIEDARLCGNSWELFLFCKTRLLKQLRELLTRKPYENHVVLRAPDYVFPEVGPCLPNISTFKDVREQARIFLEAGNKILKDRVGTERLSRYLEQCRVSPKEFLSAGS